MSKKILFLCFAFTTIILGGCILNLPIIILAAVGVLCIAILALDLKEATYLLFYFSPLSYILVYGSYGIYIFPIVAYILAVLLKKQNIVGILAAFFLLAYCIIFADFEVALKLGQLIYPILLFVLFFVCQFTERREYKKLLIYFLLGFIVSAIIGLFKDRIPFIQNILTSDALYIEGVTTTLDIQRYSGLSYDPNFFALLDCILISSLIFGEKKIGLLKGAALLFLIVIGFFTFSKSYVILLAIILVAYIFINTKTPFRKIFLILCAIGLLMLVENFSEIKILSLIEARFETSDDANDLTTGRIDLWLEYLSYILNNVGCLFFGEGFNALSLKKAAHNTYIDFVYRFGIFGTFFWMLYFIWCKKMVDRKGEIKTSRNITALIFFVGIFFLSAFHFQQLWCCIFFALVSPYLYGGENEEIDCNSSGIQC